MSGTPDLSYIAEALRPFAVPVSSLLLDPSNARIHPDRNIEAIRKSLVQFGQQRAILLHEDGLTVIAGNGTLRATMLLERPYIAAMPSGLAGADAKAFGLADNRTAESASWDHEALADLLTELAAENYPTDALGWDGAEVESLLTSLRQSDHDGEQSEPAVAPEQFKEYDEAIETQFCCPKCGYSWSGKPK